MEITWTPLTLVQARGFVKNYTIVYTPQTASRKRQQQDTLYKTVDENQSRATVDGLDENAAYSIQMFATTGGGRGIEGRSQTVPTPGEWYYIIIVY